MFITRATCVLGQPRRGTPSRDRGWRGQIVDGDADCTGIRQHSSILFHIVGPLWCLSMAHHYFGSF
jgi:hypothetical protein